MLEKSVSLSLFVLIIFACVEFFVVFCAWLFEFVSVSNFALVVEETTLALNPYNHFGHLSKICCVLYFC